MDEELLRKSLRDAIEVSRRLGQNCEALLRSLDAVEKEKQAAKEKPPPK